MKSSTFEPGLISDQDLETAITKVLETFDGVENLRRSKGMELRIYTQQRCVSGFGKSLAYTTSTVRDICTFAVLC